jgi:hypothetical protein
MFLGLDLPGTKDVVGDGPQLEELWRKYPQAGFPGAAKAHIISFESVPDMFSFIWHDFSADAEPKESGWSR